MSGESAEKKERPKSTVAQIVQATVSLGTLAAVVFGYLYTVQPIATKQRAEEDRDAAVLSLKHAQNEFVKAKVDRDAAVQELESAQSDAAKAIRERDRNVSDLRRSQAELGNAQAELRTARARIDETNTSLRRYVVGFYIRSVRAELATLPNRSTEWALLAIRWTREGSEGKSDGFGWGDDSTNSTLNRDSLTRISPQIDQKSAQFYLDALKVRQATGRDMLQAFLSIYELALLPENDRRKFLDTVRSFTNNQQDQRLSTKIQQQALPRDALPKAETPRTPASSEAFKTLLQAEVTRRDAARVQFAQAVDQLETLLKAALAITDN